MESLNANEASYLNELSGKILQAAMAVHRELGPGLDEPIYRQCMIIELSKRNLRCDENVVAPLYYDGTLLSEFVMDLLVEEKIVVVIKSVDMLSTVDEAEVMTYLKLADKRVGLLINFYVAELKQGFKRFVYRF